MFDVGFWELLTIGVVVLLFFGPDKIPELFSTLGRLSRRLRIMLREGRYFVERELQLHESRSYQENISDLEQLATISSSASAPSDDEAVALSSSNEILGKVLGDEPKTKTDSDFEKVVSSQQTNRAPKKP